MPRATACPVGLGRWALVLGGGPGGKAGPVEPGVEHQAATVYRIMSGAEALRMWRRRMAVVAARRRRGRRGRLPEARRLGQIARQVRPTRCCRRSGCSWRSGASLPRGGGAEWAGGGVPEGEGVGVGGHPRCFSWRHHAGVESAPESIDLAINGKDIMAAAGWKRTRGASDPGRLLDEVILDRRPAPGTA